MNIYIWTILETTIENQVIKHAKYHVLGKTQDETYKVETEGNWYFGTSFSKPFAEITEQDVIDLIRKECIRDGLNIIESRLDEQLEYLAKGNVETPAPWQPQVFTPN